MSGKKNEELSFEESMDRLEELVGTMEEGKLPLEDMIRQYETAHKLANSCREKLAAMRKKIELLTKDDGGEGVWRDAAAEETHADGQDFFDFGAGGKN